MVEVKVGSCDTVKVDRKGAACAPADAACIAASPRCEVDLTVNGTEIQLFEMSGSPHVMTPGPIGIVTGDADQYRLIGPNSPRFVPVDHDAVKALRQGIWNLDLTGPYLILRDKLTLAKQIAMLANQVLGDTSLKPDPTARPKIAHDAAQQAHRRARAFLQLSQYLYADVISRIAKTLPRSAPRTLTTEEIAQTADDIKKCYEISVHPRPFEEGAAADTPTDWKKRAQFTLQHQQRDGAPAYLTADQAFDLACATYATSLNAGVIVPEVVAAHAERILLMDQDRMLNPTMQPEGPSYQEMLWAKHENEITDYTRASVLSVFEHALHADSWEVRQEAARALISVLHTVSYHPDVLAIDARDMQTYLMVVELLHQAPLEELSLESADVLLEELFGEVSRLRALPNAREIAVARKVAREQCLAVKNPVERSACLQPLDTSDTALDRWRQQRTAPGGLTTIDPHSAAHVGIMRILMRAGSRVSLDQYAALFSMAQLGTEDALKFVVFYYHEQERVRPQHAGWRSMDQRLIGAFFALAAVQAPKKAAMIAQVADPMVRQWMISELYTQRPDIALRMTADLFALAPPHDARLAVLPELARALKNFAEQPTTARENFVAVAGDAALAMLTALTNEPAPSANYWGSAGDQPTRRDHAMIDLWHDLVPLLGEAPRKFALTGALALAVDPHCTIDKKYLLDRVATLVGPHDRDLLAYLVGAMQQPAPDAPLRAALAKQAFVAIHAPIMLNQNWDDIPPDQVYGYFVQLSQADPKLARTQFAAIAPTVRKSFTKAMNDLPVTEGIVPCADLLQGETLTSEHQPLFRYLLYFLKISHDPKMVAQIEQALLGALTNVVRHADKLIAPSDRKISVVTLRREAMQALTQLVHQAKGAERIARYHTAWVDTYFSPALATDPITRRALFALLMESVDEVSIPDFQKAFHDGINTMSAWTDTVSERELYLEHVKTVDNLSIERRK